METKESTALDDELVRELSARGVRGRLEFHRGVARLIGRRATEVPLAGLRARWGRLSSVERRRELKRCAARLAQGQARTRLSTARWRQVGVLTAASLALGWHITHTSPEREATAVAAPPVVDRLAQAAEVCELAESRVMRGGTLGPADSEGWVLEMSFLRPEQAPFAVDWDGYLETVEGQLQLTDRARPASLKGARQRFAVVIHRRRLNQREELTLTLGLPNLRSYLRSAERPHWVHLASALYVSLGATHGALYARCAHRAPRHAGTWFAGENEAAALAALLFFLGPHADSPHLPAAWLRSMETEDLPTRLQQGFGELSRQELGRRLSVDRGMVQEAAGGPVSILFPLKDSNRASRASRRLAQELGLDGIP